MRGEYCFCKIIGRITLRGGIDVLIRPILPNDIEAMKLRRRWVWTIRCSSSER